MTNPTDLLPRFAAASEWLGEHHPDAPRLPGWITIDNEGCPRFVSGKLEREWVEETPDRLENREVDNPAACLCGAVVWAMEVIEYYEGKQGLMFDTLQLPKPDGVLGGWVVWRCQFRCNGELFIVDEPTKEEAYLSFLESICESLGRDGVMDDEARLGELSEALDELDLIGMDDPVLTEANKTIKLKGRLTMATHTTPDDQPLTPTPGTIRDLTTSALNLFGGIPIRSLNELSRLVDEVGEIQKMPDPTQEQINFLEGYMAFACQVANGTHTARLMTDGSNSLQIIDLSEITL